MQNPAEQFNLMEKILYLITSVSILDLSYTMEYVYATNN